MPYVVGDFESSHSDTAAHHLRYTGGPGNRPRVRELPVWLHLLLWEKRDDGSERQMNCVHERTWLHVCVCVLAGFKLKGMGERASYRSISVQT